MDYIKSAAALKALSHPKRLEILEILRSRELSVGDIQARLKSKQSITSQHLNNMKNKGILCARKEANIVYYSITNEEVLTIIKCINSCAK